MGIDGSEFRAVNSSKNDYNQKKTDKHEQLIAKNATAYLTEMNALDNVEEQDPAQHYCKE